MRKRERHCPFTMSLSNGRSVFLGARLGRELSGIETNNLKATARFSLYPIFSDILNCVDGRTIYFTFLREISELTFICLRNYTKV